MYTRLRLAGSRPAGATLVALSTGTTNMQITGGDTMHAVNVHISGGNPVVCTSGSNLGARCGSAAINGTVSSLTFDVSMTTNRVAAGTASLVESIDGYGIAVSFPEDFSDAPLVNFTRTQVPSHVLTFEGCIPALAGLPGQQDMQANWRIDALPSAGCSQAGFAVVGAVPELNIARKSGP